MNSKITLPASVQAKNGKLYAVIQTRVDGKRKPCWRSLGLPEDASKSKVNKMFRQVVGKFEDEYAEQLALATRPARDIPVYEYMSKWLERAKPSLQINTIKSYESMIHGKIKRYFQERPELTVGSLTARDIQEFYDHLFAGGVVANTVIHYHAVLRRGFAQAFKEEVIESNPFDRIDRPKKNKFHGENYSEEELRTLLGLTKEDIIYPAILLAGGLGLRRSEALGARWSRVDFENKTILLDTKIVEYRENVKTIVEPQEEMKNKSSRRTLPLPEPVAEMLREQRERQTIYKKLFKESYNRKYEDYICTNQLGELLAPSFVTEHFGALLKKYGLRKIRYHDLRHTFASILLGHDTPLLNVSNFLGHSDISTTANIYAHLDKASKKTSADLMGAILTGGTAESTGVSA